MIQFQLFSRNNNYSLAAHLNNIHQVLHSPNSKKYSIFIASLILELKCNLNIIGEKSLHYNYNLTHLELKKCN